MRREEERRIGKEREGKRREEREEKRRKGKRKRGKKRESKKSNEETTNKSRRKSQPMRTHRNEYNIIPHIDIITNKTKDSNRNRKNKIK